MCMFYLLTYLLYFHAHNVVEMNDLDKVIFLFFGMYRIGKPLAAIYIGKAFCAPLCELRDIGLPYHWFSATHSPSPCMWWGS